MRAQVVLPVLLGPTGPPDGICFIHLKNQGYSARADNGEVCLWLLSALQCLASARPECRSHQTFDRCRSWSATLARRGGAFDPPSIGVAAGSGASSRARDECGAGGWVPRFSAGRGQGRGGKVGCLCSLDTGRVRRRKGLRRGRTTAGHSMPLAQPLARARTGIKGARAPP
jgi:hypothetical protein